jgi:hypothetical protein
MTEKRVRPHVSDPELQAALDRWGPHIEQYTARLDRVSAEIRAVEAYLRTGGLWCAVTIAVDEHTGVAWRPDVKGQWRVRYASRTPLSGRPLIETPGAIRLATRAALPALIRAIQETAMKNAPARRPQPGEVA